MPLIDGSLIGKYRALLVDHAQLPAEAARLEPALELLRRRHEDGDLGDAEFTRGFVLCFAQRRASTFSATQIRGMPGMIFDILNAWCEGRVDLRLVSYPVSAHEMLNAQAEGWRYVTVDIEAARHGRVIGGTRDAFEFALHDLGHAHAFFKTDYDPGGQVDFFKQLARDLPQLKELAAADAKFSADLEYCMADMNSHPQHLRQYLQGVIVEHCLRNAKPEPELAAILNGLETLSELVQVG